MIGTISSILETKPNRGPHGMLTALQVAQLSGVEWAEALLSNDSVMNSLCLAEFGAADKDRSGCLDRNEAWACIESTCRRFRLVTLPRKERCIELYNACNKNGDGTLQSDEFKKFFVQVLKACVRKIKAELSDTFPATSEQPRRRESSSESPSPTLAHPRQGG
jgi:hypothetical protein